MIFGDRKEFAVKVFHENLGENDTNVFGRMCLWLKDEMLGDLHESACMLDVTNRFFDSVLGRISDLSSKELSGFGDLEAFNYLEHKLYGDGECIATQVTENAVKYFKFDFLTNGDESFESSKSFIVADGFFLRILFYNYGNNKFAGHRVSRLEFANIIGQFMAWYDEVKSKLTRQST